MSFSERIHHPSTTGIGLRLYAVLLFAFLYLPLAVIAVFSVVDNTIPSLPLGSLTWEWYEDAFSNTEVWSSVRASLTVAAGAVIIAVSLGVEFRVGVILFVF